LVGGNNLAHRTKGQHRPETMTLDHTEMQDCMNSTYTQKAYFWKIDRWSAT